MKFVLTDGGQLFFAVLDQEELKSSVYFGSDFFGQTVVFLSGHFLFGFGLIQVILKQGQSVALLLEYPGDQPFFCKSLFFFFCFELGTLKRVQLEL